MRYRCEDSGEWRSKEELVGDLISGIAVSRDLWDCHDPCVNSLHLRKRYALCSPRHRPSRRWKIYFLRFIHDTSPNVQTFLSSRKPRSCRGTRQFRVRAVHRYQRPHLSRGRDERARLWAQWWARLLLRVRECSFSSS